MKYILGPMRLPFLVLAPACVFLGMAVAIWTVGSIDPLQVVLTFIGGITAHISVNALNEYFDIKSGLDLKTVRTPFSGGSGVLPEDPSKAPYALWTGLVSVAITTAIGVHFYTLRGWPILALGLVGLVIIFTYTVWLNKLPVLCLIAPGLGFGTLMVSATYFALTGTITWTAFLVSFIPFFLVSNLLLLNQFPDADADKTVGRRHLPILIGRKSSSVVLTIFLFATYIAIILGVIFKLAPAWTLIGLATILLAIPTAKNAIQNSDDLPKLMPSLAQNVLINLLTPLLVGVGFLVG